ncbi:MAG: serine/threonine protein kinase [Pseudomonadota bacterium]
MSDSFFELTPDLVLAAVEASGLRCNGRCIPLNSYENRVYELELEEDESEDGAAKHVISRRRVVKFYRPGRWSRDQILEEHQFLQDLLEDEVPVVAPIRFPNGETLHSAQESGLWYTVFPKVGGRIPDEMDEDQLQWLGRLLGRIHNVGASRKGLYRLSLTPATYGTSNLEYLLANNWLPPNLRERYASAVREICRLAEAPFASVAPIRLHGDCHRNNLLWGTQGPFFLDFDDMVIGPPVQDLWLLVPGRDSEARLHLDSLIRGYEEFRTFDRASLKMIEILRALRFVHFSAWMARRWEDPAFPRAFPYFNTPKYWEDQTRDVMDQAERIQTA